RLPAPPGGTLAPLRRSRPGPEDDHRVQGRRAPVGLHRGVHPRRARLLLHPRRSAGEQHAGLRHQHVGQADHLRGLIMTFLRRAAAVLSVSLLLLAPAGAALNSAQYKFEGNRWLSLDLAVGDVRTDVIRFDWPSAVLGIKTGYKATVKVVNGSARQVSAGVVVAVYDGTGKLVGAGSSGTKIGTIDPGDSADFQI